MGRIFNDIKDLIALRAKNSIEDEFVFHFNK